MCLRLTFDDISEKRLVSKPFANTATGSAFRREAKAVFDQEPKT